MHTLRLHYRISLQRCGDCHQVMVRQKARCTQQVLQSPINWGCENRIRAVKQAPQANGSDRRRIDSWAERLELVRFCQVLLTARLGNSPGDLVVGRESHFGGPALLNQFAMGLLPPREF